LGQVWVKLERMYSEKKYVFFEKEGINILCSSIKKSFSIIILIIAFSTSCSSGKIQSKNQTSDNRSDILGRSFSNSEVKSIDIVQIEDPMLGGIIDEIKLTNIQKESFLTDFDNLIQKGMFKCGSKYVIRLNFNSDTLKLKVCDKMISNRMNDLYYELENGENLVEKYIDIK
jgi:hypothetical protein